MTFACAVSYPLLVGDIGGTNIRFGILEEPDGALALLPRALTSEHRDPIAALQAALDSDGRLRPRSALLAVASRIETMPVQMTNTGWTVDAEAIGAAFGLESVALVN